MTEYTIREATQEDLLDVIIAAKNFSKEASQKSWAKFDTNKTNLLFKQLVDSEFGFVYIALHENEVVGGLISMITEMPINDFRVAQELMLWIDPNHRNGKTAPKLIDKYVEWAKEKDCSFVRLSEIDNVLNSKAGILFRRKGFEPVETAYVKEI